MHRRTGSGIAAVLAGTIIAITAESAQADKPPILPTPIVSIDLVPDPDPDPKPTKTTASASATPKSAASTTSQTTTSPAGAAETKAAPKETRTTARPARATGTSKGSAAQRGAAVATSPSPSRTLRPAAPKSPSPTAAERSAYQRDGQDAAAESDDATPVNAGLLALTIAFGLGMVAMARHRKGYAEGFVDGAAGRRSLMDTRKGKWPLRVVD